MDRSLSDITTIRFARISDYRELSQVYAEYLAEFYRHLTIDEGDLSDISKNVLIKVLQDTRYNVLVFIHRKKMVGFCIIERFGNIPQIAILDFYVVKNVRRLGIGTMAFTALLPLFTYQRMGKPFHILTALYIENGGVPFLYNMAKRFNLFMESDVITDIRPVAPFIISLSQPYHLVRYPDFQ